MTVLEELVHDRLQSNGTNSISPTDIARLVIGDSAEIDAPIGPEQN